MTIKQRLEQDPRVLEVWSEAEFGDGFWVSLRNGFINSESGTHCIHEWTWTAVRNAMRDVEPCNCRDCQPLKVKP